MNKLNLKCEGVKLWGDSQTKRRYNQTLKRVLDWVLGGSVIDIGGYSEFGDRMATRLSLEYNHTVHDLNYVKDYGPYYDYMFCFEVIEHLMNPLLFLEQLRFNKYIFLTYPYSPILQGKRHFHEMTPDQFYTLIDAAGLKTVHHDSFRNYLTPKIYFTGFRPLIKLVLQILGLSKIHFYVLEKK